MRETNEVFIKEAESIIGSGKEAEGRKTGYKGGDARSRVRCKC